MDYAQAKPALDKIISRLNAIEHHLRCLSCGGDVDITMAGVGDVPDDLQSFTVIKTSSGGTVTITMSNGSVYTMTVQGETFTQSASPGGKLPDYLISTSDGATWKWQGIK